MGDFAANQESAVKVGNSAGWLIEFYPAGKNGTIGEKKLASFGSSTYYASIDASLPDQLAGGGYTFIIQGLTDADFALISQDKKKTAAEKAVAAKLYLFWQDAISGPASYLKNLVGLASDLAPGDLEKALVAVLHVDTVKRKLGELSYDTEIHCSEWAYYRMTDTLADQLKTDDYRDAARKIAQKSGVTIKVHPDDSSRLTTDATGVKGGEAATYDKGMAYGAVLKWIANAVEANRNKHGRGLLLIRDGAINLGVRNYPLDGAKKDLTAASGLLKAEPNGSSEEDPSSPDASGASQRAHYLVTLKGRPDIKPGDLVCFDPPPAVDDSITVPGLKDAVFGSFMGSLLPAMDDAPSAAAVLMAVSSVRHRQGKAWGFYTEVTGVTVPPNQPWDEYKNDSAKPKTASPAADGGTDAANAIKEHLDTWSSNLQTIDIGQVREFTAKNRSDTSPAQTETVREGLTPQDRNPNGTRRLPIDAKKAMRMDLPYASPFAWGKCGLVLPRYPGMRVVLAHRNGQEQEPVDVGAIWDSGEGPESEPGDYWLSLPIGVDKAKREKANDDESPGPYSGPATHDLVDGDGNRTIEVGSLCVKVPKQATQAGTRPKPLTDGSITIEHEGGAKIVMKQDGSILIQGKGITLDAGSGTIVLKGSSVDVQ